MKSGTEENKSATVIIRKKRNDELYIEAVQWALKKIDLKKSIKPAHKILIDLNLLLDESYTYGNITDPRTVEGVVDYLINHLNIPAKNIWVGDGGFLSDTPGAIRRLDLPQMADKYGFYIIDLNKDIRIKDYPVPNPIAIEKLNIAKTAHEADVIISIPSLKMHSMAVTTLSIKNLMALFNLKVLCTQIFIKNLQIF
ncbi:MAG: DUF362 domain-containing protein [Promethearchaeota archaeon]